MILVDKVPPSGPLTVGAVYKRSQLHSRFGGNRNAGIVPSTKEPVILLFHTDEAIQQFYSDGFDGDGVYWYCGEGTRGDVSWTSGNRAIRDHAANGMELFLFERVRRTGGFWRFSFALQYVCYTQEKRKDKAGASRIAIVFGLVPLPERTAITGGLANLTAADLRNASADGSLNEELPVDVKLRQLLRRSEAVQQYALARARGLCEACGVSASFTSMDGYPFLEVHRLDHLCDSGPDRIDSVAAVCPNCHRRCHYAVDQHAFNSDLRRKVAAVEASLQ